MKDEIFSPNIRNKIRMPTFPPKFHKLLKILKVRQEKKGIQIGKEEKLPLYSDAMILNVQNPKESIRNF